MQWIHALLAGLPLGVLAAQALPGAATPLRLALGALAGAVGVFGVAFGLARRRGDESGLHLARAAGAGWLALPACLLAWLGALPAAWLWATLCLVVLALAFWSALRRSVPGRSGLRTAALLVGAIAMAALVTGLGASGFAAFAPPAPEPGERFALASFDIDSRVPLGPRLVCDGTVSRVVLLDRGAHPVLANDGEGLLFDALADDGRRQVHRIGLDGGGLRCLTCSEPGNNRRPSAAPNGQAFVFDTDRHASAFNPTNTELHWMRVHDIGRGASARLTRNSGPDDHAIYDPAGYGVLWSHGSDRQFDVLRGGVGSGHGGVVLTGGQRVASGGTQRIWPLVWSRDSRALVIARGSGLGPAHATLSDPATGQSRPLSMRASGARAVAFSADGALVAVSESIASGAQWIADVAGMLSGRLLPLVAPDDAPGVGGTELRVGPREGRLESLALGDAATWGVPTGVAVSHGGRTLVLGQRRTGTGAPEERLLRIERHCAPTPAVIRRAAAPTRTAG